MLLLKIACCYLLRFAKIVLFFIIKHQKLYRTQENNLTELSRCSCCSSFLYESGSS